LTKNVIRKLLTSLNKLLKSEPARIIKMNMLPYFHTVSFIRTQIILSSFFRAEIIFLFFVTQKDILLFKKFIDIIISKEIITLFCF